MFEMIVLFLLWIFLVPPTQRSVQDGIWIDVQLIALVSDTRPSEIEFEEKREFLDLILKLLYVTKTSMNQSWQ